MRFRGSRFTTLLTIGLLLFPACDETTTGNSGDPLTPEEAELVFQLLAFYGFISFEEAIGEAMGEFSGSVDEMLPCAVENGYVTVEGTYSGSYDDEFDIGDAEAQSVIDFSDCVFYLNEVSSLTLNGDPGVDGSWEIHSNPSLFTWEVDLNGGVGFTTNDDRSGRCAVDATLTVEEDEETDEVTVSASGSVCGVNASGLAEVFEQI